MNMLSNSQLLKINQSQLRMIARMIARSQKWRNLKNGTVIVSMILLQNKNSNSN